MITSRDRRFLIDQAIEAVREALWDGRDNHPEDWRTVSIDNHLAHIEGHLEMIDFAIDGNRPIKQEDLTHLIFRAAMIRVKLKLEKGDV